MPAPNLRTGSRALDLLRVTLLHQCYDALVPWQSDETIVILCCLKSKRPCLQITQTQWSPCWLMQVSAWFCYCTQLLFNCSINHAFLCTGTLSLFASRWPFPLPGTSHTMYSLFLSARRVHASEHQVISFIFFCHCHGPFALRNLLRVSVIAFLCGALMVLPATGTGVLADWPAGAIYPVTVLLDCREQAQFVRS